MTTDDQFDVAWFSLNVSRSLLSHPQTLKSSLASYSCTSGMWKKAKVKTWRNQENSENARCIQKCFKLYSRQTRDARISENIWKYKILQWYLHFWHVNLIIGMYPIYYMIRSETLRSWQYRFATHHDPGMQSEIGDILFVPQKMPGLIPTTTCMDASKNIIQSRIIWYHTNSKQNRTENNRTLEKSWGTSICSPGFAPFNMPGRSAFLFGVLLNSMWWVGACRQKENWSISSK